MVYVKPRNGVLDEELPHRCLLCGLERPPYSVSIVPGNCGHPLCMSGPDELEQGGYLFTWSETACVYEAIDQIGEVWLLNFRIMKCWQGAGDG